MESLGDIQRELEQATPEQLQKSAIRKTKEGYRLETLTLGTRICRWFMPDQYNTMQNVVDIIRLMRKAYAEDPAKYQKMDAFIQMIQVKTGGLLKDRYTRMLENARIHLRIDELLQEKYGHLKIESKVTPLKESVVKGVSAEWEEKLEKWQGQKAEDLAKQVFSPFDRDTSRGVMIKGTKYIADPKAPVKARKDLNTVIKEALPKLGEKERQIVRLQIEELLCQQAYPLQQTYVDYMKGYIKTGAHPLDISNSQEEKFQALKAKDIMASLEVVEGKILIKGIQHHPIHSTEYEKIVGYDAFRVTYTIDPTQITPTDCLLAKGAVTAKAESHGICRTLEELRW